VIDFRYHLVSIVAIFLALATGIALGAGPLQDPLSAGLADRAEQDRQDVEQLRSELSQTQDRISFGDAYAAETAGVVVGSALAGRTVGIVSLPGSDPGDVRGLRGQVEAGGGEVVSTVRVTDTLLDPANRQLAEGLARQVLDGVKDVTAPAGATSYELVGAAVARAFLTRDEQQVDNDAGSIAAALAEADFLTVDGSVDRRAQLALVVSGDPAADAPAGQAEVAAEVVSGLDTGSAGAVVAGTAASASGGIVQAVRESEAGTAVSSVDAVDLAAGRVVTVLAMAEQLSGGVGHYGQVDAEDGAVPEPVPPSSDGQ